MSIEHGNLLIFDDAYRGMYGPIQSASMNYTIRRSPRIAGTPRIQS